MRERAQQSWPALPKTASGAGRGGLEVGVGEDDVRRLAAELERDALDRRRARQRAIPRPTSVEPVKAILATSRVLDEPLADTRARARRRR